MSLSDSVRIMALTEEQGDVTLQSSSLGVSVGVTLQSVSILTEESLLSDVQDLAIPEQAAWAVTGGVGSMTLQSGKVPMALVNVAACPASSSVEETSCLQAYVRTGLDKC